MTIPLKVRAALRKRAEIDDFVCCEICGKPFVNNAHHRRGQGQGGRDVLSNLLMLCGSGTTGCHGLVTANPAMAYRNGWSIEGTTAIPGQVPVRRLGEKVWLDDSGAILPAPPQHLEVV